MAKEIRWSEGSDRPEPQGKPKEVRWSPELERNKSPARSAEAPPLTEPAESHVPLRTKGKRKARKPHLLLVIMVPLLLAIAGLGIFFLVQKRNAEEGSFAEAEHAYQSGDYSAASNRFTQLADNYPESERQPRYAFFARLAQLQSEIRQLRAKESPVAVLDVFSEFTTAHADSPLAKPVSGFGADIVQSGQKLAGIAHEFIVEELKNYRSDRTNSDSLAAMETVEVKSRGVIAALERFRDSGSPSSQELVRKFDAIALALGEERRRAASFAEWNAALQRPTHADIERVEAAIRDAGLAGDDASRTLIAGAWKRLLAGIRYTPAHLAAVPLPNDPTEPHLAVTHLNPPPQPKPVTIVKDETCFGIAGGCLYACNANTGDFLWGRKIAPPTAHRSTVDIPMPDATGEVAFVGIQREGGAGIAAFRTRTGETLWYQPLPAPCFARPVTIGSRLFAALRDDAGTIVEFDLATGEKLGSLATQQPLAAGLIALPGDKRGRLVAICRSQRVIVMESHRSAPGTEQSPLAFVRAFSTGEANDTVNCDPLIIAAEPPLLFLVVAHGPSRSALICYRFPAERDLEIGDGNAELPLPRLTEKEFAGWPWFPPLYDGERLAITTDAGEVSAFGFAGNVGNLYSILSPSSKPAEDSVSRSAVVAMDDDSIWAVSNEHLVQFKAMVGRDGYRIVPIGKPKRVGEAVMRPQLFRGAKSAVVGIRPSQGGNSQLLAFDWGTGETRWHVELKCDEMAR